MSRCFPYPQPGYEKKPREVIDLHVKESKRDRDKKKKDKKKKKQDGDEEKKKKHRSGEEKTSSRKHGEERGRDSKEDRKDVIKKKEKEDAGKRISEEPSLLNHYPREERNGVTSHRSSSVTALATEISPSLPQGRDVCDGNEGGKTGKLGNGWLKQPKRELDEVAGVTGRSDGELGDRGKRKKEDIVSEPPVPPIDQPPGENGKNEVEDELEDNSWLNQGSRRSGKDKLSHCLGRTGGLALSEPQYLTEFDVCILPYMLPY